MKNEIEKIYLIDRYLKGELLGPALDEFRTKLRTDPDFYNEVESQRAIIEGIKLARREHLISVLKGITPPSTQNASEKNLVIDNEPTLVNTNSYPIADNEEKKGKQVYFRPNSNNWYFAAAAVLFACFFVYLIFGYYIPHQRLKSAAQNNNQKENTEKVIPENTEELEEEEPELATNPYLKDSIKSDDEEKVAVEQGKKDSDSSEQVIRDLKLSERLYSVSSYESVKSTEGNPNNVSTGNPSSLNINTIKVKGTTVKVEYWKSIVNFKGYKLSGQNLQLFDVPSGEKVNLKYLDKSLYLKKNGNFYKLNPSGTFESYQKETNEEVIKLLETN